MSLLQKIRAAYLAQQDTAGEVEEEFEAKILPLAVRRGNRGRQRGWPSGSRLGTCTAQLQMLRYPEITHPEPLPLRALMNMEKGTILESWWAHAIDQALPDQSGLKGELFYFPIVVPHAAFEEIHIQIMKRQASPKTGIWGSIINKFQRPVVALEDGRVKIRHLISRREDDPSKPRSLGFVIDEYKPGTVYIPVYIDRIVLDPEHGLICVEKKAVSNYAFRQAVLGKVDYQKRCQMMAISKATGLPVAWLMFRSETAHLLEIFYKPGTDATQVTLTKSNGMQEDYWVKNGEPDHPMLAEHEWEAAEVWTPTDDTLLPEVTQRVIDVLLAKPGQWRREYGPDFTCSTCGGTGEQTMQKHNKAVALKKSKPCEECGQVGILDRVTLPSFPCGYSLPVDTPVLMANYAWTAVGKLAPGDELVGVEEYRRPRAHGRKVTPTTVVAVAPRCKETVVITTDRGAITCSPEHPWLVRMGEKIPGAPRRREGVVWQDGPHWREASTIVPGMEISYLSDPAEPTQETEGYMAGYIRGLVEGDGHVARASTTPSVCVAMTDPPALDRLVYFLSLLGVTSRRKPRDITRQGQNSFRSRKPIEDVTFGGRRGSPSTAMILAWPLTTREAAAGYLGGLYDAEGCLAAWSLRIYQRDDSPVVDRALAAGRLLGVDLRLEPWRQGNRGAAVRLYTKSLLADLVRFFTLTRPAILRKTSMLGRSLYNSWAKVTTVASGPEMPMVDLQTTSKTFIAGGFVTHNCPVVKFCWGQAGYKLEISADRPRHYVERAAYTAAGLTYTTPPGNDEVKALPVEPEVTA